MKYMLNVLEMPLSILETITTTADDVNFVNFPAVVGNPNYDAFLVSAKLTDEEVHALDADVWYDFPIEEQA